MGINVVVVVSVVVSVFVIVVVVVAVAVVVVIGVVVAVVATRKLFFKSKEKHIKQLQLFFRRCSLVQQ